MEKSQPHKKTKTENDEFLDMAVLLFAELFYKQVIQEHDEKRKQEKQNQENHPVDSLPEDVVISNHEAKKPNN